MANYIMGGFWLHTRIHREIKREQSKFWWGKTCEPSFISISWNKICRRKSEHRLCIKDLPTMNLALTKVAWRIIAKPNSLLAKVLSARYQKGNGWGMTANVSTHLICRLVSTKGYMSIFVIMIQTLMMWSPFLHSRC